MDFLLLLSRSIHILSACVWLGGLSYQRMIFPSKVNKEWEHTGSIIRVFNRSFGKVSHIALITLLLSGIVLMISDPRFALFSVESRWSTLLVFKQIIFVLLVFYLIGYSRMLRYMGTPSSNGGFDERTLLYKQRIDQYQILSIILGITAVIFGTAMHIYG